MNVTLKKKNEQPLNADDIIAVAQQMRLNPKLVELLYSRGINSAESVKGFLSPDKSLFYDPFLLKNMDIVKARITKAINNKESVVVYGDYDADGICAAAILSLFLAGKGLNVYTHIPNRIGEGYGLNKDSLENIIEKSLPDLIITCDCGISGYKEVEYVTDLGVDIIVTDHHEISGTIPACPVINPKQADCNYPYNMLCGAGVALKVVQAIDGIDAMTEFLDLACVATIADLVPLLDENRLIVQLGLQKINERKNIGLSLLMKSQKIEQVTCADVAYKLAPRINAAGRMGDAYRAFEMLTSEDSAQISAIIDDICGDNSKRKDTCDIMYAEATEDLKHENLADERVIVLTHPDWEKGITGILAARLSGDYNRPAFVLVSSGDGLYKGTCRSIDGINIHEFLSTCADILPEFGGHSQAAGFSIKSENLPLFRRRADEYFKKFDSKLFLPECEYDLELSAGDVTYDFVQSLELLEPTGNANPKPLFKITADELKIAPCKNNCSHISATLKNGFQIFAFNFSKISYQLLGEGDKELVVELRPNSYGGKDCKGILKVCSPSSLYINDCYSGGYALSLLKYKSENPVYTEYSEDEDIDDGSLYGTLFVAFERASYEEFNSKTGGKFINEFMYPLSRNNYTKIAVAPDFDEQELFGYNKIIFLDRPISDGIATFINKNCGAKVYFPKKISQKPRISLDRSTFARYYELIRCNNNLIAENIFQLYKAFYRKNPQIELNQFIACLYVFDELNFISLEYKPVKIKINAGVKTDLSNSSIYKILSGER